MSSPTVHEFVPGWNTSPTNTLIASEFGADIYFPLRMKYNHFGDPLTFPLALSLGLNNIFLTKFFQT